MLGPFGGGQDAGQSKGAFLLARNAGGCGPMDPYLLSMCHSQISPSPKLCTIADGSCRLSHAGCCCGPLPESSAGNSYILVAGDYFNKWVEAYAIPNQEAATVARKLVDQMFCRFSPPEQLHSDL